MYISASLELWAAEIPMSGDVRRPCRYRWKIFEKCKCLKNTLRRVSDLKNFPTGKFFFDLAGQPTTQGLVRHSRPGSPLPLAQMFLTNLMGLVAGGKRPVSKATCAPGDSGRHPSSAKSLWATALLFSAKIYSTTRRASSESSSFWFNCFDGSADLVKFTPPLCERRTSLEHLVGPNLQDLRINGHIGRILPFLHKSACTLTRLTLFRCHQAESDVIHLLQGIPSLTTVAIDFASDSLPAQRALNSALTIRPGDTGLTLEACVPFWSRFHGPIARIPWTTPRLSRWWVCCGRARATSALRLSGSMLTAYE
ncbi:hypothetical protein B0H14DRAFT_2647704 [Mycena olivaceomarginata]|nr:hypothetical protein B0H14DRAFT_2647704 [Mycena olivaceomarginata]